MPWLRWLVAGQSMWDFWWTKSHLDGYCNEYFGVTVSVSIHQPSMITDSFIYDRRVNIYIYIYIYTYIYIYICDFKTSGDAFRLPYSNAFGCSIRPFLDLFHAWKYISHLSKFFGDGFVFPFQLIIIFGNRVGSILSICPNQMSCFRVISSNIVSGASIFSLIYTFVFLSSLEILADRLNASISAALILLLSSSYKIQVSAP